MFINCGGMVVKLAGKKGAVYILQAGADKKRQGPIFKNKQ